MRILSDAPFDPDLAPNVRYHREREAFKRRQRAMIREAQKEFRAVMDRHEARLTFGGRRKKKKVEE